MVIRNVRKIIRGQHTMDGAGVKLVRVLGRADVKDIDPFLMLDAFDSTKPEDYLKGFPMHPHRGIETFTYLMAGEIDHKDTLGNSGRIKGGQAQWMTSGSGILHEEMPALSDHLLGLQIWINMPKEHKMSKPTYHDVLEGDMPEITENGSAVRVVAGDYKEAHGAKGQFVQPTILDITVDEGVEFTLPVPDSETLFIYVFHGGGVFGSGGKDIPERTAAVFGGGDTFYVKADKGGVRFMLFAGAPLNEEVAWAGPIVMNTEEELRTAFLELENGSFIK